MPATLAPSPALLPVTQPAPATTSTGKRRYEFWLIWLGSWILRLLVLTLRVRFVMPPHLRDRAATKPFIFVFWHNRLLLIPVVWQRFLQAGGVHRAWR